jgi:UMP-CMP kinase
MTAPPAARNDPGSEDGQLILECIKEGALVPTAITVRLLKRAMEASLGATFLIDGFPRNLVRIYQTSTSSSHD